MLSFTLSGPERHEMGVSKIMGALFWGPYNKDPTI